MASFQCRVRVDYCKLSGVLIRSQLLKPGKFPPHVTLEWDKERGKLTMCLELGKGEELKVDLRPPLQMATAQIEEGKMGIMVANCKLTYTSEPMRLQIMLSEADPDDLAKLRDAIDVCMARILGKPMKYFPKGKPSESQDQKDMISRKRKADVLNNAPSGSELSTGSRDSLLDGVTSKPSGPHDVEELPEPSEEQQRIIDIVKEGKSVFFTGCAGTGKSLVLKHILRSLPAASTYVTASTGIAACSLGGTTLHAFAGIGRATDLASACKHAQNRDSRARWQNVKTLIVDEVSMIDADLFDMVANVAKYIRGSEEPFGGIQLILSGDFHQLPPVNKREDNKPRKFCFESHAWKNCRLHCLQLTKVYRQADSEFVEMLSKIRTGAGSSLVKELQSRCSDSVDQDGIKATKLFTHREDVDTMNSNELNSLPGDSQKFIAKDTGNEDVLKAGCPARKVLELKKGAQVMLIKNVSQKRGLVNGSRGIVQHWVGSTNPLPVVKFANGIVTTVSRETWKVSLGRKTVATRSQVPLELGWGVTVHKCQGMTLDAVQINLERAFEPGMAYVALSRVKSLEGLQLVGGIDPRALQAHPKVLSFYNHLKSLKNT